MILLQCFFFSITHECTVWAFLKVIISLSGHGRPTLMQEAEDIKNMEVMA